MPAGQSILAAKAARLLYDGCSTPARRESCKETRKLQDAMGDFVETVTAIKVGVLTLDPVGASVVVGEKLIKYSGSKSK